MLRRGSLAVGITVGAFGFALRRLQQMPPRPAFSMDLGSATLAPVRNGALVGGAPPVAASSLWAKQGAVVFVVRRPG